MRVIIFSSNQYEDKHRPRPASEQVSQTQVVPKAKWGLTKLPESCITTLTQQCWCLNLT